MVGITTIEAVKHINKYRKYSGASKDEIIQKLVETIVEEGIGNTILGTFEIDESRPIVSKPESYISSHKQGSLPESLSVKDIQAAVGSRIKDQGMSGDRKVKHHWEFLVDGVPCAIWDYYGARWSTFGPAEAFAKLGLHVSPLRY